MVEYEWPFNHSTESKVLTAGTNRYAYPTGTKTVDFDSFRIQRDDTLGNRSVHLKIMDYDYFLANLVDDEYNTSNTGIRALPEYVFRTPDSKYGVWKIPDQAYTLDFEYYSLPSDLSAYDDTPTIPESFKHVIVEGAMSKAWNFKSDMENSDRSKRVFDEGIERMRSIYINRYIDFRDTRVPQRNASRYTTVIE